MRKTRMHPRHYTLIAACAQYAFVSCLQAALFPAVLTSVQQYMNASNTAMALLVAAYDLTQVGASLPFASLCLRIGSFRSLAVGGVISAAGGVIFAISTSIWSLVIAQLLMGVGFASITVLCPHVMALISPSAHEASLYLSMAYASASGGVVLGYIAAGVIGPQQWRFLFGVNALTIVPVVYYFMQNEDPVHPGGGTAEKESGDEEPTNTASPAGVEGDDVVALAAVSDFSAARASVATILSNRVIVFGILSQSSVGFGLAALIAFIPKYITNILQQSTSVSSLLMALSVPASAIGVLASGYLARKYAMSAFQLSQLVACCCSASISLAGMFLSSSVPLFTLLLVCEMMIVFASMVPSVMVFPQLLPRNLVPFANALSNTSVRLLGSVPGPILLGVLLDVATNGHRSDGPLEDPQTASRVQYCYLFVALLSLSSATLCAVLSLRAYRSMPSAFSQS